MRLETYYLLAAMFVLSACVTWEMEARHAGTSPEAYRKAKELSDIDGINTLFVASAIAARCDSVIINKKASEMMRGELNRAVVFQSKENVVAGYERLKQDFQRKYKKPLIADLNHCDAAEREILEQTAISAFLMPS